VRGESDGGEMITLQWKKVKEADGYLIYGNQCGKKYKLKLVKTIKKNKTVKLNFKGLKKGTYPLFRNRHLVIMLLIHQCFAKFCTISAKLVSISLSAPKSYHQNSINSAFLIALCELFH
jgi:hypothetical protein